MMTKREKTGFFPLCVYQPKINELIFFVCFSGDSGQTRSAWGQSSVSKQLRLLFVLRLIFILTICNK
ncbi:hypothetical protein FEM41_20755 [Jejubacter calystegiae]|uniref:Uncharacterized protein n=1 Tax=Jejubacter calystegiae TaxID=2579935 RepID=A0A4P8YM42_9ENTR|nr:hypothetical protein FEM41_20755 [Jejubacter calystegiae]